MKTWRRLKPTALALIVPLLLLAFWQVATTNGWTLLIPTPYQVGEYMIDFAVGGIYDDALEGTLRYPNDPLLNDAMAAAVKQNVGGGAWIFSKGRSLQDISALYAATFARWLFREKAGENYDLNDSIL